MSTHRNENPGQENQGHNRDNQRNEQNRNQEQSQRMRSDNDDFNDSGLNDQDRMGRERDSRHAQSKTFNEREDSWEEEQRMEGRDSEVGHKSPRNNNWHDDEQRNASGRGRFDDADQNRFGQENDRRNREELE